MPRGSFLFLPIFPLSPFHPMKNIQSEPHGKFPVFPTWRDLETY